MNSLSGSFRKIRAYNMKQRIVHLTLYYCSAFLYNHNPHIHWFLQCLEMYQCLVRISKIHKLLSEEMSPNLIPIWFTPNCENVCTFGFTIPGKHPSCIPVKTFRSSYDSMSISHIPCFLLFLFQSAHLHGSLQSQYRFHIINKR